MTGIDNLGSKDGEDELSRVEGVENIGDNAEVGGCWDIGLKADITELLLRSDVYGDIFTKAIVLTLIEEDTIHRIPTRMEQIIIYLHVGNKGGNS